MFNGSSNNPHRLLIVVATVSLLTLAAVVAMFTIIAPLNYASAMGQAPSTCKNVYGGTITSFLIAYPGGTFDALSQSNSTFAMPSVDATYTVTFIIHTANTSNGDGGTNHGNSLPGDTWYGTTAPGYGNGVCVPGAGPNRDITVHVTVTAPPIAGHTNHTVGVEWYSLAPKTDVVIINRAVSIQYAVAWSLLDTTSSSTSSSSSTTMSSSSSETMVISTSSSGVTTTTSISPAITAINQMIGWLLSLLAMLLRVG